MRINIIGSGNVAYHLNKAFYGKGEIHYVNPRSLEGLADKADLTLISVSDSAIGSVLENLSQKRNDLGIVAHTSGSTPIDIFNNFPFTKYGVFYPLQTFSKNKELDYSIIPFFIEGNDKKTEERLMSCAREISESVQSADSSQRERLHVAAVLSSNFINHLWTLSEDYLKDAGLDFRALLPLINETVKKVSVISPSDAQTGPASRGDRGIVEKHLDSLTPYPSIKNIYSLLSKSIFNYYKNERNCIRSK
ncbi:MAG: DUF2520 domain-containing protein [Bacteroidales bacterium]|nr:DUF2520 domain-containing protein [Bacteroidales bacterium]